ncbi:MAG: hypothetical protein NXI01_02995 [Gammaproteobacteria bacterium]|nr:hypothetical protein [Gammaproteobacteria bacterium]
MHAENETEYYKKQKEIRFQRTGIFRSKDVMGSGDISFCFDRVIQGITQHREFTQLSLSGGGRQPIELTVIDLSNSQIENLSPEEWRRLCSVLAEQKKLVYLSLALNDFSKYRFPSNNWAVLGEALAQCPELTTLDLSLGFSSTPRSGTSIAMHWDWSAIGKMVNSIHTLRALELAHIELEAFDTHAVFTTTLEQNKTLCYLNYWTYKRFYGITTALADRLSGNKAAWTAAKATEAKREILAAMPAPSWFERAAQVFRSPTLEIPIPTPENSSVSTMKTHISNYILSAANPHHSVQNRCIAINALNTLMTTAPEHRNTIREEGGIALLIDCLEHDDTSIKEYTAKTLLSLLRTNELNLYVFRELSVLDRIRQHMQRSTNPNIRSNLQEIIDILAPVSSSTGRETATTPVFPSGYNDMLFRNRRSDRGIVEAEDSLINLKQQHKALRESVSRKNTLSRYSSGDPSLLEITDQKIAAYIGDVFNRFEQCQDSLPAEQLRYVKKMESLIMNIISQDDRKTYQVLLEIQAYIVKLHNAVIHLNRRSRMDNAAFITLSRDLLALFESHDLLQDARVAEVRVSDLPSQNVCFSPPDAAEDRHISDIRQEGKGSSPTVEQFISKKHLEADLICPITFELMTDPVMTCKGQTYERANIERWFRMGHHSDPISNEPLEDLSLTPNIVLRKIIDTYNSKSVSFTAAADAKQTEESLAVSAKALPGQTVLLQPRNKQAVAAVSVGTRSLDQDSNRVRRMQGILQAGQFAHNASIIIEHRDGCETRDQYGVYQENTAGDRSLLLAATPDSVSLHRPFLRQANNGANVLTSARLVLASIGITEASTTIPSIDIGREGRNQVLADAIRAEHARLLRRLSAVNTENDTTMRNTFA